jgi:hypothetical protein
MAFGFTILIGHETQNPAVIAQDSLDEYIRCYSLPGGLRCMVEIHRAILQDAEQNWDAAT